jgi:hypothetical protein
MEWRLNYCRERSGNGFEIIIRDGWLNKRRINQFIEDLETAQEMK